MAAGVKTIAPWAGLRLVGAAASTSPAPPTPTAIPAARTSEPTILYYGKPEQVLMISLPWVISPMIVQSWLVKILPSSMPLSGTFLYLSVAAVPCVFSEFSGS